LPIGFLTTGQHGHQDRNIQVNRNSKRIVSMFFKNCSRIILEGVNMRLVKMMKSIFAEHYNLVQMKSEGIKRRQSTWRN